MSDTLKIGDQAPDFTLTTDTKGDISLSDFKGKKLVLFFYPKDNTPGCTTEACEFSESLDAFKLENCEIVGISADSIKKHENFRNKHQLTVTLGSDENHDVLNAYGVWKMKKNYGKEYMGIVRSTFLISEDGQIIDCWTKVRVKDHVNNVLIKLKSL
ncbi:MAG: thioredoxin-dependent thiol peroxidase [Rhizobiales bacterium]|nr:thioredoxin-dependent thiol peroxidase [Hyphomicrobiales bacterium]